MWKQLEVDTTNTCKKAVLTHILDPSNMVDEEVYIFLRKHLVPDITTQNFGFRYTTACDMSHHRVAPFTVLSLYPTTIAHIDITQQAEGRFITMTVDDNNSTAKGPPPPP